MEEIFKEHHSFAGAVAAGYGDLMFHLWGYCLCFLTCWVTALYLTLIAKFSKETQLDRFSLMMYNNVLSLPAMLLLAIFTEGKELVSFNQWFDVGFQARNVRVLKEVQPFLSNVRWYSSFPVC